MSRIYPVLFVISLVLFGAAMVAGAYASLDRDGHMPKVDNLVAASEAERLRSSGDERGAVRHYVRLARIEPGNLAYFQAVEELSRNIGDRRSEIFAVRHLLGVRPSADRHNRLARLLLEVNRWEPDEAIAHSQQALRFDPGSAPAFCNLALAAHWANQPEQAEHYLEKMRELDPSLECAPESLREPDSQAS